MTQAATSARTPRSAVLARLSGPNRNGPLSRARLAQILAPGYCPEIKFVAQQISLHQASAHQAAETEQQAAELSALVATIQDAAAREEWSQRKLSAVVGVRRTSWQRLCSGRGNPSEWLPRLRSAAARILQTSP